MTGFGAASSEDGGHALHAEVRSVNHRHLLVKTRVPSDFSFLEGEIEALVKKRLERGSISLNLRVDRATSAGAVLVDVDRAAGYKSQLLELAERLEIEPNVSLDTLLALPGVVPGPEVGAIDGQAMRGNVLELIDEALARLVEMREVEGRAIEKELAKHAAATTRLVARIETRMPTVVRTHQRNLEKRVREIVGERGALSPIDMAREIAILCDRLDVSEEIARLKSHLDQLHAFVEKGGRVGRRLDFLVQEIFREINTIGSKCSDAKVAHWVVDAKSHAERLREQVQNVE